MKKKIIRSFIALMAVLLAGASFEFYRYRQRVANNEAGICAETGTILSAQELRARVLENFLWQMLKERTVTGEYVLKGSGILVINRHISKNEIISMIENSRGKEFLREVVREPETVIFVGHDVSAEHLGLFDIFAQPFASGQSHIKHYPALINKMAKAKILFNGDFSFIIYDASYNDPWFQERHKYGGVIAIISGDSIYLNNDEFRKQYGNFSVYRSKITYDFIYHGKPVPKTEKRVNTFMSGPYDHAYGRFFYQYHKNNFGIQYDSLYSDVNNKREYIDAEEKRREKIQEAKDNDINRINEHYFDSRFLHVSNCGDILE